MKSILCEEDEFYNEESENVGYPILSLAILPDNKLISGSKSIPLKIWDYTTHELVSELYDSTISVDNIIVHENMTLAYSKKHIVAWKGSRKIYEIRTLRPIKQVLIINICFPDQYLQLWDLNTGKHIGDLIDQAAAITFILKLPHNKMGAGYHNGALTIWDMDTLQVDKYFVGKGHSISHGVFIDSKIVVSEYCERDKIYDYPTGKLLNSLKMDMILSLTAYGRDRIIVALTNSSLQIWSLNQTMIRENKRGEPATHERILQMNEQLVGKISLSVLPNGDIVSSAKDGIIYVWYKRDYTFKAHEGAINALLILPDGSLVSGGTDGSIKIIFSKLSLR